MTLIIYLEIIKNDLHCNSIRISGQDIERLAMAAKYALEQGLDVYFCGTKPMRESRKKQFRNSKLNISNFYYEYFQFK